MDSKVIFVLIKQTNYISIEVQRSLFVLGYSYKKANITFPI